MKLTTCLVVGVTTALSLSSCFLSQEQPSKVNQVSGPAAEGLVLMEDVQGVGTAGLILAVFGKKADTAKTARKTISKLDQQDFDMEFPVVNFDWMPVKTQSRETRCRLSKGPKSSDGRGASRANSFVSAGKLGFGPITSSTLDLVPEDNGHRYAKKIEAGFGSGLYRVVVEGSADVVAFKDILPVPEALKGVQINGVAMEDGAVIKKSVGADIQWNPTAVYDDSNKMLIDIYADLDTETYQLHCQASEKDFYTPFDGAPLHWNFPAKAFAQIPTTEHAQVYLKRGQSRTVKDDRLDVDLEGLRINVANFTLQE